MISFQIYKDPFPHPFSSYQYPFLSFSFIMLFLFLGLFSMGSYWLAHGCMHMYGVAQWRWGEGWNSGPAEGAKCDTSF